MFTLYTVMIVRLKIKLINLLFPFKNYPLRHQLWFLLQNKLKAKKSIFQKLKITFECSYIYICITPHWAYFVLHTLQGFKTSNSLKRFLNNFFVIFPIATKFSDIISVLIGLVFTKNEPFCFKIAPGIRFLSIKWRKKNLWNSKTNLNCVQK